MLANDNHASSHNHQQQPPSSSPPPKAVNIVRPSSPFVNGPHHQRPHHDSPLLSRPSVLGTTNFFSLYATQHAHTFGNGPISWPQHLLQRARSSSNLSRNSMLSSEDDIDNDQDQIDSIDGNDDDSIDEEEDSIDGISDSSSSIHDDIIDDRPRSIIQMDDISSSSSSNEDEEEVSPSKIVARIKNGTIMNGRGEFLNKGGNDEEDDDDHDGWLDEARANRKIADLEIEKSSLLAVNTTLEATLRRQEARIAELEKRLSSNIHDDQPPSPAPEKPTFEVDEELTEKLSNEAVENDEIFQRLRRTLQGMIENAESALVQKVNMSARVLAEYAQQEENEGIVKRLSIRRSWTPSTNTAIVNRQHQRPPRNTTSSNKKKNRQSSPPSTSASNTRTTQPPPARPVINHTKTSMARTLSRSSSPAVMVSPSSSPTISRNTRPPSRASSLRRSITPQQSEAPPRWR